MRLPLPIRLIVLSGFALALPSPQTSLNDLPVCAQQAGLAAITATGCGLADLACICESVPFLSTLRTYIMGNCEPKDQQAALTFGQAICLQAGITISAQVTIPSSSPTTTTTMPFSISFAPDAVITTMSGTATSTMTTSTMMATAPLVMASDISSTTSMITIMMGNSSSVSAETSTMTGPGVAIFTGGAMLGVDGMGNKGMIVLGLGAVMGSWMVLAW